MLSLWENMYWQTAQAAIRNVIFDVGYVGCDFNQSISRFLDIMRLSQMVYALTFIWISPLIISWKLEFDRLQNEIPFFQLIILPSSFDLYCFHPYEAPSPILSILTFVPFALQCSDPCIHALMHIFLNHHASLGHMSNEIRFSHLRHLFRCKSNGLILNDKKDVWEASMFLGSKLIDFVTAVSSFLAPV